MDERYFSAARRAWTASARYADDLDREAALKLASIFAARAFGLDVRKGCGDADPAAPRQQLREAGGRDLRMARWDSDASASDGFGLSPVGEGVGGFGGEDDGHPAPSMTAWRSFLT